jgi:hypothetical protein
MSWSWEKVDEKYIRTFFWQLNASNETRDCCMKRNQATYIDTFTFDITIFANVQLLDNKNAYYIYMAQAL